MSYRFQSGIKSSEITSKSMWLNRRALLASSGAALAAAALPTSASAKLNPIKSAFSTSQKPNSMEDITTYNNFYEFGTGKEDPSKYAHTLTTSPWTVKIDGMVDKPGDYTLEDILSNATIEERIYRFRCVEAWAMVIPWAGFELASLLNRVGVQPGAKYVSFETLVRPSEMRGQSGGIVDWPYREGLTINEAMHPLTILANGIYDEDLPNQNGAPLRLVVPWKYGFKSIKSIVKISLTDKKPQTTWNMINAREYGFYSNVNPGVSHPRWSQSSHRVIGGGLFAKREETELYNGYGDQVASLYDGLDLKKNY
ncbi:MAG: sulfoxide reductase catalytic subunit YedY [Candidatus Paceibacteria bacterium]|jgi:sulfoxide reductase catalytic subunit YedY